MRVLFVTPSDTGTGEAMTASYVARDLLRHGHDVDFCASRTTAALLSKTFPGRVTVFGHAAEENRQLWRGVIRRMAPDSIVFADYPLLFMTSGTVPLATPEWVADLLSASTRLMTFDHLGFAQSPGVVYFGPPHLTMHAEHFAAVPPQMDLLLPCPLFEGRSSSRRGTPVRSGPQRATLPAPVRTRIRRQYLADDERYLVVHSTPGWAIHMAAAMQLPHYDMLPRLLAHYLADLDGPAVMVSVNDGSLLPELAQSHVRIVNVATLPPDEFEWLLLSADLVLSDNKVSSSVARAVCAEVPSAVLVNSMRLPEAAAVEDDFVKDTVNDMETRRPGSIFPFEVFPIWSRRELDQLALFTEPLYREALLTVELFGGQETARVLTGALMDEALKHLVRRAQRSYITSLSTVAAAADVVLNN